MGVVVISVVVALVVAVVIGGVVVVGMRGGLPEVSEKAPDIAGSLEWAARQLNGEAEPSPRLVGLERAVTRRRLSRAGATQDGQVDPGQDGGHGTAAPEVESATAQPNGSATAPPTGSATTGGAAPGPAGADGATGDPRTAPRRSSLPSTGDFGG
ncbi:hypothetical protein [Raineyella sp. LH-20]|uniref:hypothetical protein n=1 Tax=Raineyella sp. LH-20 TaxID=3081204 RepID=UPI002952D959|nr:hypothetical protein [Raineyella sp. LH-20]WOP18422.1 hypothetical protein R0146_14555 [Raineyella sp. LH-20]